MIPLPNLVTSPHSTRIDEDGAAYQVQMFKLDGNDKWLLEVVIEDGTSFIWDKLFDDDAVALNEAVSAICPGRAVAEGNYISNVIPFRR